MKTEEMTIEEQIETIRNHLLIIRKYEEYEHVIDSLQMIIDNENDYWIKSNNCMSELGIRIILDCMKRVGWEVNPMLPKISAKYLSKLDEALSKCPFNKEQAISFVENENRPCIAKPSEESKSFWDWFLGLWK